MVGGAYYGVLSRIAKRTSCKKGGRLPGGSASESACVSNGRDVVVRAEGGEGALEPEALWRNATSD